MIEFSLDAFLDEEGVRYVPVRPRPPITLLRHYRNPWKAAYHHFQRYSDVRVKGQSAAQSAARSLAAPFSWDEALQRASSGGLSMPPRGVLGALSYLVLMRNPT